MRRNVASQVVCGQMNSRTDGSPLTSAVGIQVLKDGGTQGAGAGTLAHEGNGCWSYIPTQGETDANHVAFTFTHASGVHQTVNVYTLDYVYQAKIGVIDDNGGTTDRYTASFFKDGQPIFTGMSAVSIQVIKAADGADLIAAASMTQIGSTGLYKYDATAGARMVDGAAYVAKVSATIDGATRTWSQWVGRDSA